MASGFFRRLREEFGGGGDPSPGSSGAVGPVAAPQEICAALQEHYKAGDPLAWQKMPFRHLLPMVDAMWRQKARAMLREIRVAHLAQANPKDQAVVSALADLERQAGFMQSPIHSSMSLDQVRSIFHGMEEI